MGLPGEEVGSGVWGRGSGGGGGIYENGVGVPVRLGAQKGVWGHIENETDGLKPVRGRAWQTRGVDGWPSLGKGVSHAA